MVADLHGRASHGIVDEALTILENLEHRGATGADVDSGDGAGILLQMPDSFIRDVFGDQVPARGSYGVGFWMLPRDTPRAELTSAIEKHFTRLGLATLAWRDVPVA